MTEAALLVRDDSDPGILAWRERATDLFLKALAIIGLPLVVSAGLGRPLLVSPREVYVGAAAYASVLVALSISQRRRLLRAAIVFSSVYVLASYLLLTRGLPGTGRIFLMVFPVLSTVLLGTMAGWIAAGVSSAVVVARALLGWAGVAILPPLGRIANVEPSYWLWQALWFVAIVFPVTLLVTRIVNLQASTTAAERRARRALEAEAARRRRVEAEVMRAGEEERRRLGGELHDGICQQLTAALLHCAAVEDHLEDEDRADVNAVRRLRSMLEEAIGMAYDMSKGLCPLDLDPASLVSALDRLARQTRASADIACRFHSEGEVVVRDSQQGLQLFRIAQESVANAVKHSRGSEIEIRLARDPGALVLSVRDNGVGHWPAANTTVGGMGLQLMRYRAESIGADLTIDSPDGGGTIVTCRAPLDAPAEPL